MQHIKPRNTHDCKKEKKTKNEQKNQLNPPKKKKSPKSWSKLHFSPNKHCLAEYAKTTVNAVLYKSHSKNTASLGLTLETFDL